LRFIAVSGGGKLLRCLFQDCTVTSSVQFSTVSPGRTNSERAFTPRSCVYPSTHVLPSGDPGPTTPGWGNQPPFVWAAVSVGTGAGWEGGRGAGAEFRAVAWVSQ